MAIHPSQRYNAPHSIQAGVPLKTIIDQALVDLIAQSLRQVVPSFNTRRFKRNACERLETFELKGRAQHIADAMQQELPEDFEETSAILIRSMGPELTITQDYGLKPFFYMPHSDLIARYGVTHFKHGMAANYELTKRYTAEFSVRPYIQERPEESLRLLEKWTRDNNPHVRRLVSEGSRPRLPWGMRLKQIDAQPELTLPLLERLKDDPEFYVRRSVANHLGDIGKANLPVLIETCQCWLDQSKRLKNKETAKHRRWIIRHALRHPAKKGESQAMEIRSAAK